jgi:prevent-host-death family protein
MNEISITEARGKLATLVDSAQRGPVYLTRRRRPVVALVDAEQLRLLLDAAEELEDIRAVDAAWAETERLDEEPVPWEDVKRDLGLA